MPDNTKIYYYPNNTIGNVCFDKNTSEAYGLFKDGKIDPLSDEAIRWCESNNIKMRDDVLSDDESVDSSDDEAEDDEAENEEDEEDDDLDDLEDDDDDDDAEGSD
jgi:DNA-directed RNA polymerase delta subunit